MRKLVHTLEVNLMSAITIFKGLGLELDKRYEWAMPAGLVDDVAITEADSKIQAFNNSHSFGGWGRRSNIPCVLNFPMLTNLVECDSDNWRQWVVGSGDYVGTIPKRYNSYVKSKLGVNVPDALLGDIGSCLGRSLTKAGDTFSIDFTNDFNWYAGEFGERSDSCWWGMYNGARLGLMKVGGIAMRFYDRLTSRAGVGRCWIYADDLDDSPLLLFNAYHRGGRSLLWMARLLSYNTGLLYTSIELNAGGRAWINSNSGVAVAKVDHLPSSHAEVRVDFAEASGFSCAECGCFVDEDEACEFNGEYYCENCYNDNVCECDHCGDHYWGRDNMYWAESTGEWFCEWCYNRHYFTCSECNEIFRDTEAIVVDGDYYCSSCVNDLFFRCDRCDEYVLPDDWCSEFDCCFDCLTEDERASLNENLNVNSSEVDNDSIGG